MTDNGASTIEMVRSLLREVSEYLRGAVRLVAAEFREQSRSLRTLAMMAGAAMLLLLFSFGLLTVALVGVIAYGLDSWRWSLVIVGVAYGMLGLITLLPVAGGLRKGLLHFDHTRHRLSEDVRWAKQKLAADTKPEAPDTAVEPRRAA